MVRRRFSAPFASAGVSTRAARWRRRAAEEIVRRSRPGAAVSCGRPLRLAQGVCSRTSSPRSPRSRGGGDGASRGDNWWPTSPGRPASPRRKVSSPRTSPRRRRTAQPSPRQRPVVDTPDAQAARAHHVDNVGSQSEEPNSQPETLPLENVSSDHLELQHVALLISEISGISKSDIKKITSELIEELENTTVSVSAKPTNGDGQTSDEAKDSPDKVKKFDTVAMPEDFRCLISLDLMRDHVIVSTGQSEEPDKPTATGDYLTLDFCEESGPIENIHSRISMMSFKDFTGDPAEVGFLEFFCRRAGALKTASIYLASPSFISFSKDEAFAKVAGWEEVRV
ncbi:hypothetical protein ZWY2020_005320 [Hordeum vulgare]|nr:hypothetical protein ZWY2020_005320 [Hordeum vulgare]